MTIYEIDKRMRDIIDIYLAQVPEFDIEEDELINILAHNLEYNALADKLDEKTCNIARYIVHLEYEKKAISAEIKKLQHRGRVLENQIARLKRLITMVVKPGQRLQDASVQISWRKSTSVHVENSELIPDEYKRYIEKIDKKTIRERLKDGETVPGATLESKQNLQIR